MKTKDKVFIKYKEFKPFVGNERGRKRKVLLSHNGGEYTSKDFDAFCRDVGMQGLRRC